MKLWWLNKSKRNFWSLWWELIRSCSLLPIFFVRFNSYDCWNALPYKRAFALQPCISCRSRPSCQHSRSSGHHLHWSWIPLDGSRNWPIASNIVLARPYPHHVWAGSPDSGFRGHPGIRGHGVYSTGNRHGYLALQVAECSPHLGTSIMNQFYNQPELKKNVPIDVFLEEYYKHSTLIGPHFMSYALLCKARCCLSIIYYLVKIGLGDSENLWFVLVEAEKSLAHSTISRN